jgi:hypothetical protein
MAIQVECPQCQNRFEVLGPGSPEQDRKHPQPRSPFPWSAVWIVVIGILFLLLILSVGFNITVLFNPEYHSVREQQMIAREQEARAQADAARAAEMMARQAQDQAQTRREGLKRENDELRRQVEHLRDQLEEARRAAKEPHKEK